MLYHAVALLHFRSVRHSIVAVREGVAVRRQHRWRHRISTYLCGPDVPRSCGLLATAMSPCLSFVRRWWRLS